MNTERFTDFLLTMDSIVSRSVGAATSSNEAALLDDAEVALSALIARDDWLPEIYTRPSVEKYQQYLLYADPQGRYSVQSFVWGPGSARRFTTTPCGA
jgi:predicted metal-dependent enzyme (double-stranded beta helix superfamily)